MAYADLYLCLYFEDSPYCYDQKRPLDTNGRPTNDLDQGITLISEKCTLVPNETMKLTFKRPLASQDANDNNITPGQNQIILWSYGNTNINFTVLNPVFDYHGITNRDRVVVTLVES